MHRRNVQRTVRQLSAWQQFRPVTLYNVTLHRQNVIQGRTRVFWDRITSRVAMCGTGFVVPNHVSVVETLPHFRIMSLHPNGMFLVAQTFLEDTSDECLGHGQLGIFETVTRTAYLVKWPIMKCTCLHTLFQTGTKKVFQTSRSIEVV